MSSKSHREKDTDSEMQNNNSKATTGNPWKLIARFSLCNALIGFGAGMIVPYFNLYFRDWVGASIPQIGMVFAMGQFGTALGSISSPFIAKRIGLIKGVAISQLCSLPFMLLMAWQNEFWLCSLCFIFRGAFMNMCTPMRQETTMEIVPQRHRARASAAESMSWNLSWATAMFFSGGIIKNYGYDTSLYLAFACYLASGLLYYHFFHPWEKRKKTQPTAFNKPIAGN
jgi:MFS family permease